MCSFAIETIWSDDNDGRKARTCFEQFAKTSYYNTIWCDSIFPFLTVSSTALSTNPTNGYVIAKFNRLL
jgi:hypothetical protein